MFRMFLPLARNRLFCRKKIINQISFSDLEPKRKNVERTADDGGSVTLNEKKWIDAGEYAAKFTTLAVFILINLRRLFEPFRDIGPPFVGESHYAIRALNYLRHGYFTNWLGVCNNLNPYPDQLTFKISEMPAYCIVNSLGFRFFGVSTVSFRVVELIYAVSFFALITFSGYRFLGRKAGMSAGVLMLIAPINIFLLYISWCFLFPFASLFFYFCWHESKSKKLLFLSILCAALGCLHHAAGYFVVPALLIHAFATRSIKDNIRGIGAIIVVCCVVGGAYVAQVALLHDKVEVLGKRMMWESFLNVAYLEEFLSFNAGKLLRNYYQLIPIPLAALGLVWLIGKLFSKKPLAQKDWFILLLFIFPLTFCLSFAVMVASHIHFLTMFGPFLTLAAADLILNWKAPGIRSAAAIRALGMAALIYFLAAGSYKTHRKYDKMVWNPSNERGYRLASTLKNMVSEKEAVAGMPEFGRCFTCMSPAFYFYLQRNYYGGISSMDELLDLKKEKAVSLFLLPVLNVQEDEASWRLLGESLTRSYPFHTDPSRSDIRIYDLRAPFFLKNPTSN